MTFPTARLVTVVAVLSGICAVVSGCGQNTGNEMARQEDGHSSRSSFQFFAPTSAWNEPVQRHAQVDPSSASLVAALGAQVAAELRSGSGPWISTASFSVPVYTVSAKQPPVSVRLASPFAEPSLRAALHAVPLPSDAQPASGSDAQLAVWQPSTNRLWEFWRLSRTESGWQARWGGAMQDVSHSDGVFGEQSWPGAQASWGASASSLSILGGLIRFGDLESGSIDHALALSLPEIRAGVYASPARRSDGTSANPVSLPEGAHLRLNPHLDLSKLRMPRLTRMIAKAAQRYGIIVRDRAGNITFYAQDPVTAPSDPYGGKAGYFGGQYPSQLLASFPWRHLQVLKMRLHREAG